MQEWCRGAGTERALFPRSASSQSSSGLLEAPAGLHWEGLWRRVPGELGWENPRWPPGWLVGELVSRSCSDLPGGKGGCSTLVCWGRSPWKGGAALSKAFWPLAMEQVGAKPLVGGSGQLAQPLSGFRASGNSLSLSGLQFLHG